MRRLLRAAAVLLLAAAPARAITQIQGWQISSNVLTSIFLPTDARYYGVLCNGVSTDTAHLQAALNASYEVKLPTGTCVLDNTVKFNGGTRLIGSGKDATFFRYTGSTTAFVTVSTGVRTYSQYFADFTVITATNTGTTAFSLDSVSRSRWVSVVADGFGVGWDLYSPVGGYSVYNRFDDCMAQNIGRVNTSTGGVGAYLHGSSTNANKFYGFRTNNFVFVGNSTGAWIANSNENLFEGSQFETNNAGLGVWLTATRDSLTDANVIAFSRFEMANSTGIINGADVGATQVHGNYPTGISTPMLDSGYATNVLGGERNGSVNGTPGSIPQLRIGKALVADSFVAGNGTHSYDPPGCVIIGSNAFNGCGTNLEVEGQMSFGFGVNKSTTDTVGGITLAVGASFIMKGDSSLPGGFSRFISRQHDTEVQFPFIEGHKYGGGDLIESFEVSGTTWGIGHTRQGSYAGYFVIGQGSPGTNAGTQITPSTAPFVISGAGLVGIGGLVPGVPLDVNGMVRSSSLTVVNGLTASSGTFTTIGNTQYSLKTSSGISVGGSGGVVATFFSGTYYGDGTNLSGVSSADSTKVAKLGDTMTGQLTLSGSSLTVTSSSGVLVSYNVRAGSVTIGTNNGTTIAGNSTQLVFGSTSPTLGLGLYAFKAATNAYFIVAAGLDPGGKGITLYNANSDGSVDIANNSIQIGGPSNAGVILGGQGPAASELDVRGGISIGGGAVKSTFTTTGALTLGFSQALNLSGANGNVIGQASMTATAFFGDGSHLSGITGTTPGGAASGDLSGTYPSPSVVGASGSFTIDNGSLTIRTSALDPNTISTRTLSAANVALSSLFIASRNVTSSGLIQDSALQFYTPGSTPSPLLRMTRFAQGTLQAPFFDLLTGSGTLSTPYFYSGPPGVGTGLGGFRMLVSTGLSPITVGQVSWATDGNWVTDFNSTLVDPTFLAFSVVKQGSTGAAAEVARLTSSGTLAVGLTSGFKASRFEVTTGDLTAVASSTGVYIHGNAGNQTTNSSVATVIEANALSTTGPQDVLLIQNTAAANGETVPSSTWLDRVLRIVPFAPFNLSPSMDIIVHEHGEMTLGVDQSSIPAAHFQVNGGGLNKIVGSLGYTSPDVAMAITGDAATAFQIGASSLVVTSDAHFKVGGSSQPALSSCGTNPTMVLNSNDHMGSITTGSSTGTGCTITFKKAYATAPICMVVDRTSGLTSPAWTEATTTLTLTSLVSSDNYTYYCEGQ